MRAGMGGRLHAHSLHAQSCERWGRNTSHSPVHACYYAQTHAAYMRPPAVLAC
jgi:hypothetical protein